MLSGTVDAGKRFLMQEDTEVVTTCHFCHNRHDKHVVVICEVCLLVNRCKLKLIGCHLVMTSLDRNAKFVGLNLEIKHESLDS